MLSDLFMNKEETFASNNIPAPITELKAAAEACVNALRNGNKIFFMGNGGSAAEAQHLASELIGHFMSLSNPYAVIALNTDTSTITAIGNNYHFKEIFSRQLTALAKTGDVAIYLSTSGRSENILEAMKIGRTLNLVNIAFTGMKTSWMKEYSDYYIAIPSTRTPQIQEGHLILGHILCEYIENEMESTTVNDNF
jgi:D-sedoheptulose 7-phosphate isomerase